jgi:Arc/MetJ-type ribon-helix-helix transcriptional regulator
MVVMESEKMTINVSTVDLGKVDVLVDEGFYGNRTDFIRTAIRNQLAKHESDTSQSIRRTSMTVGAFHLSRKDLEERVASGEQLAISVVGLLAIDSSVSPELAREAIESVKVRGAFRASKEVKDALADRTT